MGGPVPSPAKLGCPVPLKKWVAMCRGAAVPRPSTAAAACPAPRPQPN